MHDIISVGMQHPMVRVSDERSSLLLDIQSALSIQEQMMSARESPRRIQSNQVREFHSSRNHVSRGLPLRDNNHHLSMFVEQPLNFQQISFHSE